MLTCGQKIVGPFPGDIRQGAAAFELRKDIHADLEKIAKLDKFKEKALVAAQTAVDKEARLIAKGLKTSSVVVTAEIDERLISVARKAVFNVTVAQDVRTMWQAMPANISKRIVPRETWLRYFGFAYFAY